MYNRSELREIVLKFFSDVAVSIQGIMKDQYAYHLTEKDFPVKKKWVVRVEAEREELKKREFTKVRKAIVIETKCQTVVIYQREYSRQEIIWLVFDVKRHNSLAERLMDIAKETCKNGKNSINIKPSIRKGRKTQAGCDIG